MAKVAAVQTLDGLVTTFNTVEFNVDLALVAVAVQTDVDNLAKLLVALGAEVVFEVLDPVRISLPVTRSVMVNEYWKRHVLTQPHCMHS